MDKIDFDTFINSLNKMWQDKQCPICKNNNWAVGDKLAELREFHQGGLTIGGQVYPLVTLTCNVCGYTLLFNAMRAGLVNPKMNDATSPVESVQSKSEHVERNEP